MSKEFDAYLQREFPDIPWGEPIAVSLFGGKPHYACRLCVSRDGLHGARVHTLPTDIEEVRKHITENHVIQKPARSHVRD
jgi:hypothetical protein